jgi:ABC-2 type transport system permease protein
MNASGLRVLWVHLRIAVMNELQYRANFFIQLLQSVVLVGTGLVALAVIFDHTSDLNGWTRPELMVVMGVYTMVGGLIGFFIEPNMARIMSDIHQGTFDYVLTKPVDSQLLSSVRQFRLWRLVDVGVGGGVIVWGLVRLDGDVRVDEVGGFLVTLAAGMILLYCLWLMVTAAAFWVVRMDMVQDLFTGMYRAGQYPVTVYPLGLKMVLTYLVPIGFAVTVPAESLTDRLTWTRLGMTIVFLAVVFVVTRLIWRAGTRHYSGASA